jgi:EPS-associated MarR family transcriptional regulator
MIEYKVFRELQRNPGHTQRSLAQRLGVSLGKVNYVLGGLAEKGMVKARRLKNEPGKIRWNYILTPKGMQEKARVTKTYLERRLREFDDLQEEILQLKQELAGKSGE